MAIFAVLDADNIVENVIVADTLENAQDATKKECIELSETSVCSIGWTYDNKLNIFLDPNPPVIEDTITEPELDLEGL